MKQTSLDLKHAILNNYTTRFPLANALNTFDNMDVLDALSDIETIKLYLELKFAEIQNGTFNTRTIKS